jgi:drug/metabolite transporter (DMT)-like permease
MTDTAAPGATSVRPTHPSARPQRRRNGAGTAALVLGVLGLVLAVLFIFAPLGALLGLIAAVLGGLGIARANKGAADNRGQAVAGLLTGLAGLVIGVAITVSAGSFLARHATDLNSFGSCMDNAATAQARETCAQQFTDRLDK